MFYNLIVDPSIKYTFHIDGPGYLSNCLEMVELQPFQTFSTIIGLVTSFSGDETMKIVII